MRSIDLGRKARCAAPTTRYEIATCDKIAEHIDEFASRCRSAHFIDLNERIQEFRSDPNMYYNTAVNYCHYSRFRIFSEERRLVCASRDPACARPKTRSPLDMIGYLGELIAAQNYIDEPYVPLVLFGRSTESDFDFVDVPLFEVKRGEPSGSAAVAVQHAGATYYIPRPDFGSRTEARSLQTLELVLQTVQAATHRDDLPKTLPSYAVISGK